jgi:hypothetical protein
LRRGVGRLAETDIAAVEGQVDEALERERERDARRPSS